MPRTEHRLNGLPVTDGLPVHPDMEDTYGDLGYIIRYARAISDGLEHGPSKRLDRETTTAIHDAHTSMITAYHRMVTGQGRVKSLETG